VIGCAQRGGYIYITREDGTYSIVTTRGVNVYLYSSTTSTEQYSSPYILISPYASTRNTSIYKFYIWPNSTNQLDKIDFGIVNPTHFLNDFTPSYGSCKDGRVYLFGEDEFVPLSDPTLQPSMGVFRVPFIPGGGGVHNSIAYFMYSNLPLHFSSSSLSLSFPLPRSPP
jgi:hypothetical protein